MAYSAGTAFVQVVPSLRGWNRSLQTQLNQASGLGIAAGQQIGGNVAQGVQQGAAQARGGLSRMVGGMAVAGRAALGGLGAASGIGLALMAKDAVSAGIKFAAFGEQAQTAFTTMLGGADKAQSMMKDLSTFAAKTPFELPQVTSAAQRLMAFGFRAQDVIPTLTSIGDAVAGMGGGAEQVNQVTNAIGQMSAKGRIQSDEILQLTEAGIPALRILANQYGVTTGEMQDMVTQGLVPSSEAIPKLLGGISEGTTGAAGETTRFAGMMEQQSKTLTGTWSNFTDNFNAALGKMVTPALPAIKAGLSGITTALTVVPQFIGKYIGPIFRDIGEVITRYVVPHLKDLWRVIEPLAKIVGGIVFLAFKYLAWLLKNVVGPVFGWLWNVAIGPILHLIANGLNWLLSVAEPVWRAISAAAVWAYENVLRPVFDAIMAGLRVVGAVFAWLWENIIRPYWTAIATIIGWVWDNAIRPVFALLEAYIRVVATVFTWLWESVIRPVWSAISTAISWAWDNVLRPTFDAIKQAIRWVGEAFAAVAEGIRVAWSKIKEYAAVPVNFVIETVWNNGIRAAWNAITGWIPGLKDKVRLDRIDPIRFASGGILPGYAPGRDSILSLLSPGEAVLVPELVRLLGPRTIIAANRAARAGRGGSGTGPSPGLLPGYDIGGIVNWGKNLVSSIVGSIGDAASFTTRFIKDPYGTLASMIPGLGGLSAFADSALGRMVGSLPEGIIHALVDEVKAAFGSGTAAALGGGTGVEGLQQFARAQAGKRYLWGATGPANWDCSGLVGALWAITQGKPPYQRHFTTAAMGAGRFGMKAGPGVFTVYLGPGHTAANIGGLHAEAYGGNGVPLAIGRVGTPLSYYNQILHVFAEGGMVPPPSSETARRRQFLAHGWPEPYDNGGWLPPGASTVYNGTGSPEAVLTAAQWNQIKSGARSDGGTFTGTLVLDSGQFLGVVDGRIAAADDATGRAITRRTR